MEFQGLGDEHYLRLALQQAKLAADDQEVPVGAILVCEGTILAKAYNQTERLCDCTAHAEMLALTAGFNALGSKYLPECTLYVTLEPCVMCAGALAWSQLGRLVYGAYDPKGGYSRFGDKLLHPKTQVTPGLMTAECAAPLEAFFAARRKS